jgi:hypothetical protein
MRPGDCLGDTSAAAQVTVDPVQVRITARRSGQTLTRSPLAFSRRTMSLPRWPVPPVTSTPFNRLHLDLAECLDYVGLTITRMAVARSCV